MNETRIEAEEIKRNAWEAYLNGEISREDALDIIACAEMDAVLAEMETKCEHCTGTVLFYWWSFSITRCDWGCGKIQFEWEHRDGVTRTFLIV